MPSLNLFNPTDNRSARLELAPLYQARFESNQDDSLRNFPLTPSLVKRKIAFPLLAYAAFSPTDRLFTFGGVAHLRWQRFFGCSYGEGEA